MLKPLLKDTDPIVVFDQFLIVLFLVLSSDIVTQLSKVLVSDTDDLVLQCFLFFVDRTLDKLGAL